MSFKNNNKSIKINYHFYCFYLFVVVFYLRGLDGYL